LTADKDFGELVFRQQRLSPGIILIRLAGMPANEKASLVAGVVKDHEAELAQAFTVLTPKTVRIRR
jgi:predicted nuclease of predicted toxin-antitoxin system